MKNNVKYFLLVSFALFVIEKANAQTARTTVKEKHTIDKFLENCLSHTEGLTETGSCGCIKIAREKWEEEVELNYNSLIAASSDKEKQLLKSMHADWVKYKEVRFKFLDEIYVKKAGDFSATLEEEKVKILKAYALELKELYHSSKDM